MGILMPVKLSSTKLRFLNFDMYSCFSLYTMKTMPPKKPNSQSKQVSAKGGISRKRSYQSKLAIKKRKERE